MADTKQEIRDLIAANLPDNTSGLITPQKHREVLLEVVNSMWSLAALEPLQSSYGDFVHEGGHNFIGALQKDGADVFVANKAVFVNSADDLPAPVAGVYPLADDITYVQVDDLNIGADRISMGVNTVWTGFESLNITLTYTGTGTLFTMVDTSNRISRVFLNAPNGKLYDWSSSSGEQLRVDDVQSTSASFGSFSGASSIIRFTNVSPVCSVTGLDFAGTWQSLLFDTSGAGILAGDFFDLGTAVFDSILITQALMSLGVGVDFITGLSSSGNISTGGLGSVLSTRGTGGALSGVSVDNIRWEFFHNDDIPDTIRDALISSQSALTTTPAGAGVFTKVNATWVIATESGFVADTTGRITWGGEKPIKVPVDMSLSVQPQSGTNKTLRTRLAVNGTTIAASERSTRTDGGDASSVTTPWQIIFQPGDYVEAFVARDDAGGIICSSGIIRIN